MKNFIIIAIILIIIVGFFVWKSKQKKDEKIDVAKTNNKPLANPGKGIDVPFGTMIPGKSIN